MRVACRGLSFIAFLLAGAVAFPPAALSGAAPDDDGAALLAAVRSAVADGRVAQSRELGFTLGKKEFRDAPDDAAFLTGLDVGVGKFMNIENIYAVRANYWTAQGDVRLQEHGLFRDKRGPKGKTIKTKVLHTVHVQARPGYAVGGLTVRSGLNINGLSVTFMKINGAALDPTQSYESEWVGDRTGGGEAVLNGDGAPVAALFGRQDEEKATALGLIYATAPEAALAAPVAAAPPKPLPLMPEPPRRKPSPQPEAEPPQQNIAKEAPPTAPPANEVDPVAAEPTATVEDADAASATEEWPLWVTAGIPAVVFLAVGGLCVLAILNPFGRKPAQSRSMEERATAALWRKTAAVSPSALCVEPGKSPRQRPAVGNQEAIDLSEEDVLAPAPAANEPILEPVVVRKAAAPSARAWPRMEV